jgi:hypothetical protein
LPHYTPEHQPKIELDPSATQTEIPSMVTPKRYSSSSDDVTIDLQHLDKTPLFLDKQYGIRKDGDTLMIGNSTVNLEGPGVITISGKQFKLKKGLSELLTRKNGDADMIPPNDMKRHKSILEMTNAHLKRYEPGGNVEISRGLKYTKVICNHFPSCTIRHHWVKY